MRRPPSFLALFAIAFGCGSSEEYVERPPPPAHDGVHGFASGCYTIDAADFGSTNTRWLRADGDATFSFSATSQEDASRFVLRAADLGTYLFYDAERRFVVGRDTSLAREAVLDSALSLLDDAFVSPAEWTLEIAPHDPARFRVFHAASGRYLTTRGLSADPAEAATVSFYPATGCATFPELTVDAEGTPTKTTWPDGDVFGFVDAHSHPFANFGFGGAGMFHGAPFHRLGVEHALGSCEPFHGEDGRRDLVSYVYGGLGETNPDELLPILVLGKLPEPAHRTQGYPDFLDWPNAWRQPTHQTQYYRWIERAWLAGMRLVVMHATTNSVLCDFMRGLRAQPTRYSCNDMVAVEREIAEAHALERYVDAQAGGPGRGFLRIVKSPAEARAVIAQGRLAVVLGIETSNLFDCFLTPPKGAPVCDEAHVKRELDRFHALGVRALFPVHKFDNAFSAGDGDRNVGQFGSFINSGHWSNFVTDCPAVPTVFDRGRVTFGGLNKPRANYLEPAPNDMSGFADAPLVTLQPFLDALREPPLEGDYCQNAGLTPLGETLLREMMLRGMIVELDHLPRRAYARAFAMLVENQYPAMGTHGNTNDGAIYELGGLSTTRFRRCSDPARRGAMGDPLREHTRLMAERGAYPGEGFGFDLNGFAGAPGPRFGAESVCNGVPQEHFITYPFSSYAGDVQLTQPHLGNRVVDFDSEGMLHIGLVAELIEDARRDGVTDEELEPLFRSAEAYLRMWERAEARAAALRGE